MKTVINNYYDESIWFVVAFEEEFTSTKHNILYTGAGKINAAMATQWLIDNFNPSAIINVGTAGGNPNKNINVGKIYKIGKVIDRDYKTPNTILPEIVIEKALPNSRCFTGDSFVESWDDTDMEIVDMEAYAIAKVCNDPENTIPFSCYKYISDTGSDEEWNESLIKCNAAFNEMFNGDL